MTYEEILEAAKALSEREQYKLCDILIDGFTPSMKSAIRYTPEANVQDSGIKKTNRDRHNDGDFTEQERRDMDHRERFRPMG